MEIYINDCSSCLTFHPQAYVLLGEDKYLERWHSHYSAVMKYLGTGPLMMDVHMHRPNTNSKHFVDALCTQSWSYAKRNI